MMPRALLAAALLLGFGSVEAARVLDPVETSVEVSIGNLTLPTSPSGTVTVRSCAECPLKNYRLEAGAQFLVNNKPVTLAELTDLTASVRQNRRAADDALVTVFLDINTSRVTRIAMRRAGQ